MDAPQGCLAGRLKSIAVAVQLSRYAATAGGFGLGHTVRTRPSDWSSQTTNGARSNASHDEPSPARARKRISFASCCRFFAFRGASSCAEHSAAPESGETFFPRSFYFFWSLSSNPGKRAEARAYHVCP